LYHSAQCNYAKCHCAKQNYLNGTNVLLKNKFSALKMDAAKTRYSWLSHHSDECSYDKCCAAKHPCKNILLEKYIFLLQNKITNPLCQIILQILILLNVTPSNKPSCFIGSFIAKK
jgi:hypothetical protein